jgi:acylphosphatase
MQTVHLIISGKVQGVFYRVSAKEKADELGISGWVKNTASGDVEILAVGATDKIQEFIEWCHKGPRRAKVTGVTITEKETEDHKGFEILR